MRSGADYSNIKLKYGAKRRFLDILQKEILLLC